MIRQIKYFQAVIRNNSFSEAAEECHISQSAISQQIQALERELGFTLLQRKGRKFELTPADEQECLKVGFLRCYSGQEFHLALEEFAGKYPDIPVEVFYGNHDELYHMLIENEVDLAFNDQRRAFSDEFMNNREDSVVSW